MTPLKQAGLGAFILLIAASGCSSSSPSPSTGTEDALRSTTIPKDFTFATTRAVSLRIEAKASAIQAVGNMGGLQVRTADGTEVYRGPISADSPLDLQVVVPSKDSQLKVTLFTGKGQKTEASLDITQAQASKVFE